MNRHQRRKLKKNKDAIQPAQQDLINVIKIHSNKNFVLAEKEYKKIIQIDPKNYEAVRHLGILFYDTNRNEEAYNCFQEAIRINPRGFEAYNNLGMVNLRNNNLELTEKCFRKSHELSPSYIPAINNLAGLYAKLLKKDEAILYAKKGLSLKADNPVTQNQYAKALILNDQLEEAIKVLEQLCEKYPVPDFQVNLSSAYKELGSFKKSEQIINDGFKNNFKHLDFFVGYASNKSNSLTQEQIKHYENVMDEGGGLSSHQKVKICETFFTYYKNKKDFKQSEKYLIKMNKLQYDLQKFDFKLEENLFRSIKNIFKKDLSYTLDGNGKIIPIFICGMPRSGTTLCEQILSSHSIVTGAGELNYLASLAGFEGMIQVNKEDLKEFEKNITKQDFLINFRSQYFKKLQNHRRDKSKYVCDKMPHNFIFIGLIKTVFPEAKIIYCKRDPIDNCFSLYSHKFVEMSHQYSYDQKTLGTYYKLHSKLMEFWLNKYKEEIYVLDNEELIKNQEKVSKEIVDFCNLQWENQCLEFYKTKRQIRTASIEQVRQPLNTKSIGAWKKYESSLTELINQLQ